MATYEPRDLAFAESAPIQFEHTELVPATPSQIWEVLADNERWTRWFPSLKSCTPTSTPSTGVGSTRTVGLAGGIKVEERFIAWDEPELWAFTGTSGPPMWKGLVERVTLAPSGDSTQVTYRMAIQPAPGMGWLVKLMGGGVRKALGEALGNLGAEVERRRSESGSDAA